MSCVCVYKSSATLKYWFCAIRKRLNKRTLSTTAWRSRPACDEHPLCILLCALRLHPHRKCLLLMPDSGIMVRNSWCLIHMHFAKLLCGLSSVRRDLRHMQAITVSVFTLQDARNSLWCPWIWESHLIHVFSKPVFTLCSVCLPLWTGHCDCERDEWNPWHYLNATRASLFMDCIWSFVTPVFLKQCFKGYKLLRLLLLVCWCSSNWNKIE